MEGLTQHQATQQVWIRMTIWFLACFAAYYLGGGWAVLAWIASPFFFPAVQRIPKIEIRAE